MSPISAMLMTNFFKKAKRFRKTYTEKHCPRITVIYQEGCNILGRTFKNCSEDEIAILKNSQRDSNPKWLIEKNIEFMRMTLFSDGKGGIKPNGFNDLQTDDLKKWTNYSLIFSFLNEGIQVDLLCLLGCSAKEINFFINMT